MAKTVKSAATDSASLLDTITGTQGTTNTQDILDTQDTQKKKIGRPKTSPDDISRINLKLPTELKEYLSVAAARESITQKKTVSVTTYLCDLIRADMERNQ